MIGGAYGRNSVIITQNAINNNNITHLPFVDIARLLYGSPSGHFTIAVSNEAFGLVSPKRTKAIKKRI